MERSRNTPRRNTTNSSFEYTPPAEKMRDQRDREGGGPDVPRVGGACDHGSLSDPGLGRGELGGPRQGASKHVFFCTYWFKVCDHLGLALRTKKGEKHGVLLE